MKTKVLEVHPHFPELNLIAECAKIIRKGGLVIFPTETVYGIAADFANEKAMERLREVKHRPEGKPFSVLISQKELISNYTSSADPRIYKLISKFWPGPLTVVVPMHEDGKTIGVRMPAHPIALKLVSESQCTIAAPSANFDSHPPPVTCAEALRDMDGLVDVAIDGGEAQIGQSSTVVDFTVDPPKVTREGVITQQDVDREIRKKTILFICTGNSCRSVMAEYLLKSLLVGRDDVEVRSAGTSVFLHTSASSETIAVLKEEGIDASAHHSQPINSILLKQADLIFVMTHTHRSQVIERVPEVEKRIYLLREFANIPANFPGSLEIPDPIGLEHSAYKECLSIIKEAVFKIVELI